MKGKDLTFWRCQKLHSKYFTVLQKKSFRHASSDGRTTGFCVVTPKGGKYFKGA
jgi:hypothetical protein